MPQPDAFFESLKIRSAFPEPEASPEAAPEAGTFLQNFYASMSLLTKYVSDPEADAQVKRDAEAWCYRPGQPCIKVNPIIMILTYQAQQLTQNLITG